MKYTSAQAIEALKKLGDQDAELVADDAADSEFSVDTVIQTVDEARIAFHKPAIVAEAKEEAAGDIVGKNNAIVRRALSKATGVPFKDLDAIKELDDVVKFAVGKHKETLSGSEKTMQEAIKAERAEFAEKLRIAEETGTAAVKAERDRFYDREISESIFDGLKDAPILNTADRKVVSAMVKEKLSKDMQIDFEEGVGVKYIDRKTNLPAKNKAGTGPFDLKEAAQEILSPFALWQKDMRTQNPVDATNLQGRNYNTDGTRNDARNDSDPMASMVAAVNGFVGD